jgi:hypothetical protein
VLWKCRWVAMPAWSSGFDDLVLACEHRTAAGRTGEEEHRHEMDPRRILRRPGRQVGADLGTVLRATAGVHPGQRNLPGRRSGGPAHPAERCGTAPYRDEYPRRRVLHCGDRRVQRRDLHQPSRRDAVLPSPNQGFMGVGFTSDTCPCCKNGRGETSNLFMSGNFNSNPAKIAITSPPASEVAGP